MTPPPEHYEVKYKGALKNMMKKGDISAKASLADLEGKTHLYALGAIEDLKGEIQIFDGQVFNTAVKNKTIQIDRSYTKKASLLVYAEVEHWQEFSIPNDIKSYADMEKFIAQTAQSNGVSVDYPFPFLIEGTPQTIDWHVIDWKDGDTEHSHQKHIESGLHGSLKNTPMQILGFYSTAHQAIFTHHTVYTHLHFKTNDDRLAGHLDDITLGENMILKLPTEGENNQTTSIDYPAKGQEIAAVTFATLAGQLQKSIKKGGLAEAVSYCNVAAYPLVDSLSEVYQADIRRTSLKVRNPQNTPNSKEKLILQQYAEAEKAGTPLKPIVNELMSDAVSFYAPIKVNDFCLKCHGKVGETLQAADYHIIQNLYPEDKAVDYMAGDLRGMWSITFHKKAQ